MGPYQLLNITLLQFGVFFKKIIARVFEKEKKLKGCSDEMTKDCIKLSLKLRTSS